MTMLSLAESGFKWPGRVKRRRGDGEWRSGGVEFAEPWKNWRFVLRLGNAISSHK